MPPRCYFKANTNKNTAKAIRYTIKTVKLFFLTNLSKISIAKMPNKVLATKPTKIGQIEIDESKLNEVTNLKTPAITTIGTESKKENLAASSRLNPANMPAEIVAPDLDTPGNNASDCIKPINKLFFTVNLASVFLLNFSAKSIKALPTNKNMATAVKLLKVVSNKSLNKKPRSAAGIQRQDTLFHCSF